MPENKGFIDRPPRIQPILPHETINIPNPPNTEEKQQSMRQLILPLITIVGYVVVSAFGQGRNLLMIIPMGLAVVVSTVLAFLEYRNEQREKEEKMAAYDLRLAEMRKEMNTAHDAQRLFYTYNYPDSASVLRMDGTGRDSRSGSRLWERRSTDKDFGAIRLGIGARESTVIYEVSDTEENDENPQMKDAVKLAEDSQIVFDVPITIPLFQNNAEALTGLSQDGEEAEIARHAIGISGKPEDVYSFVRALLTNFVAFHSPIDANLHVVGVNRAESQWQWIKELPHCPTPRVKDQRNYFPICFEASTGKDFDKEKDKVSLFWKLLRLQLDSREMRLQDDKFKGDVRLPFLLIVVDMLEPLNDQWLENSTLKDLESDAAVSTIINRGLHLGAAMLVLVPDRRKVPTGCTAVIEVSRLDETTLDFHYAEVGLNTPRYVGVADGITNPAPLKNFAEGLAQWEVRRSYGEDIPGSITLLEMYRAEDIEGIEILQRWSDSTKPEKSDWMECALGLMSGNEVRRLFFSADRDGVHGMIAGSTGSGKSELLMTMILSLAVRYDPTIINFVLIDYKGGAAFVPFENLPHCVDIVTNLGGAAVDRMFAAITAELNRRQEINTKNNVKHIVHYRQKAMHLDTNRPPYPHLFVIIDEFAEMMAGNAEYKAQLNSITRLGRALGVTLILAAQRPTGVTDQMRANIKFRISLRVETREESAEMLRRPDAAYLPPGVPGRGYLQVGNENIEMIQVAFSGADYADYNMMDEGEQGIDLNKYKERDVIWVGRLTEETEPPKLFEVLVKEMERIARVHSKPQKKPWPSPLRKYIGLNDPIPEPEYLHPDDKYELERQLLNPNDTLTFNPALTAWDKGLKQHWDGINWRDDAMRAVVGLIDDPGNARQLMLRLEMRRGHAALFGASGWGKTTFLRSLAMSLASTHSPEELHIYVLDFGGRNLEVLRELPHVGAIITPDEEERVLRLLRKLDSLLEERKQIFSQAQASSLFSYNTANNPLPAILVMIDNFAEFRDNFENSIPLLTSLVREGLSNGLHFIVTGEQSNAIPGRLFSLFTERLTLKLADANDYTTIVGRGVPGLEEVTGRGFIAIDRTPLTFQTSLPVSLIEEERAQGKDETKRLADLIGNLAEAWSDGWSDPSLVPFPIDTLSTFVTLDNLLNEVENVPASPHAAIGIDDADLKPLLINLQQQPHFSISGQQLSGKTTALRAWLLSLAANYTPDEVGIIMLDAQGYLFNYSGKHSLADLPHVLGVAYEPEHLKSIIQHLQYEYEVLPAEQMSRRELFVFIDNYDDFKDLKPDVAFLSALTRSKPGRPPVHFVVCGTPLGLKTQDDFVRRVTMTRYSMAMDTASVTQPPLNANLPRSLREAELPLGRGFIVKAGKLAMLQIATPYNQDEEISTALDRWVEAMLKRYPKQKAAWKDIPEGAITDEKRDTGSTKTTSAAKEETQPVAPPQPAFTQEQIQTLKKQLGDLGFPSDMLEMMPSEGILEMAGRYGLVQLEESTPEQEPVPTNEPTD